MSPGNDKTISECPVAKDANVETSSSSSSHSWASWLGLGGGKSSNGTTTTPVPTDGCPVKHNDKVPASLEEAAGYSQAPHPDQKGVALSTHRMVSSIPRGATEENEKGPHHQPKAVQREQQQEQPSHWIYPSEQQFFHALRKKGWDHVEAKAIPSVLEIHNTINERTWKQVQEWEQDMDLPLTSKSGAPKWSDTDLKLVRFQGRPNDLSPQAFVWTTLLRWNEPPFDRHDWYVQKQSRSTSTTGSTTNTTEFPIQRYVIDYYMMPPPHPDMPPTPFVDARPALDSPRAFFQRAWRMCQEEMPALVAEYTDWKARQPRYYDGHGPYMKTNDNKTSKAAAMN